MLRARQPASALQLDGGFVVPTPDERYEKNHPLVRAHPWAFEDEDEKPVERATRGPGEKSNTRRS